MSECVLTDEQIAAVAYLRVQRARAIDWLGLRWRGRAMCTHRYVDSHGVDTSRHARYDERRSA
jgi:hypothetical protein